MTTRALVLGGGGPVGIAWEAGLLAGLAEGGADLANADFILGTSAGSFVGAQLALGRPAAELTAAILAEADRPRPARTGATGPAPDLLPLMRMMREARAGLREPGEIRREIGAFALAATTMDEDAFIASFGRTFAAIGDEVWPSPAFACTAVDALTGDFVVWDSTSAVGLTRAVASSCSVPGVFPPISLKGRRYIDGGMRSGSNADLAKGHDLTVVIALRLGGDTDMGRATQAQLDEEIAVLRDAGGRVELITPDAASHSAFGPNLMDPAHRPAAARAGLSQGAGIAAVVASFWGNRY